jgi:hypothetical protein
VLDLIQKDVTADAVRVETPSQNLESYFLDVVERARRASAETSGATSGATVAPYLRSESAGAVQREKLLERLTTPKVRAPEAGPAPVQPQPDQSRLAALTQQKVAPASPVEPAPSQAAKEDIAQANKKLAALMRSKQDKGGPGA